MESRRTPSKSQAEKWSRVKAIKEKTTEVSPIGGLWVTYGQKQDCNTAALSWNPSGNTPESLEWALKPLWEADLVLPSSTLHSHCDCFYLPIDLRQGPFLFLVRVSRILCLWRRHHPGPRMDSSELVAFTHPVIVMSPWWLLWQNSSTFHSLWTDFRLDVHTLLPVSPTAGLPSSLVS